MFSSPSIFILEKHVVAKHLFSFLVFVSVVVFAVFAASGTFRLLDLSPPGAAALCQALQLEGSKMFRQTSRFALEELQCIFHGNVPTIG